MGFVDQQLRYSEGNVSGLQLEEKRLGSWRAGNVGGLTEAWGFPRALMGLEGLAGAPSSPLQALLRSD